MPLLDGLGKPGKGVTRSPSTRPTAKQATRTWTPPAGARDSTLQPWSSRPTVPFIPLVALRTVTVCSTPSSRPVRADSSMTFATTVSRPWPSGMFLTVEVTTMLPSAVTSAAGTNCVGSAAGDPIGRAASRSRPAPARLSSRYPVCGPGVPARPCHSKATCSLPAQDALNVNPLDLVVQVLAAPVAIVTTRTPVYRQVLALQSRTSLASRRPSRDRAASDTERSLGRPIGSVLAFAERPLAAPRSRENLVMFG